MSARGSVFRRCSCRDESGRELGKRCPRLAERGHGTWSFTVELPPLSNGKRRQVKRGGFSTKGAATAELNRLLGQEGRGVDTLSGARMTVEVWLRQWLAGKGDVRATTERGYRGHVENYLIPKLGHHRLAELRPQHIGAALRTILDDTADNERPVTAPTLQRIRATLRSALTAAIKARLIDYNPASHAELPSAGRPKAVLWSEARTEAFWAECDRAARAAAKPGKEPAVTFAIYRDAPRPPVAVWSPEQLGAFLDSTGGDRLGSLYEVIALTGLRRGEACGLRWQDVDIKRGVMVVHEQRVPVGYRVTAGPPKTKAGEERIIELDGQAVGVLLAHQLAQHADRAAWGSDYAAGGYVFTHEDGRPLHPEHVTRHFSLLAFRAGLPPIRLHDLRHGHASLMLAAGVPLAQVSKRIGHSSLAITADTYSHLLEGVGRAAADRANALIPRQSAGPFPTASLPEGVAELGQDASGETNMQVKGAPPGRLELPTLRLTVACSAN